MFLEEEGAGSSFRRNHPLVEGWRALDVTAQRWSTIEIVLKAQTLDVKVDAAAGRIDHPNPKEALADSTGSG